MYYFFKQVMLVFFSFIAGVCTTLALSSFPLSGGFGIGTILAGIAVFLALAVVIFALEQVVIAVEAVPRQHEIKLPNGIARPEEM